MRLLFLFLLLNSVAYGQETKMAKDIFPDSYFGHYKGDLVIRSDNGTQEVPMQFILGKTEQDGVYEYVLIYGKDATKKDERRYLLKAIDSSKGRYQVDEQNGIVLDAYQQGSTLKSIFEVQGNLIVTTMNFTRDGFMGFEIIMVKHDNPTLTGGLSEEIPPVKSFPIKVMQTAFLFKQKD